jgi:DNA-binding transcriptional LysR family regulator
MRSLNLDQLRALLAVVEHGSFSAAARILNLTQPAVSLQVRELERRYGVELIERLGKQAHATAPGHALVEAAQRIFHECGLADAAMRRYREGWIGRVRIATTNTALMYELPPILRRLSLEYPGIDLHVMNMPTRDSVARIIQNAFDIAVVTLPVHKAQLRVTPLREENLVAIFPVAARDLPEEVTPAFAARQPLLMEHTGGAVHALVARWLSEHGPLPRAPMHLGTIEALRSAVASNLGMSIVPEVVVQGSPDVVARPLRPPLTRTLALIEHRNKPNERALAIVREALLTLTQRGASSGARHAGGDKQEASPFPQRASAGPRRRPGPASGNRGARRSRRASA